MCLDCFELVQTRERFVGTYMSLFGWYRYESMFMLLCIGVYVWLCNVEESMCSWMNVRVCYVY